MHDMSLRAILLAFEAGWIDVEEALELTGLDLLELYEAADDADRLIAEVSYRRVMRLTLH